MTFLLLLLVLFLIRYAVVNDSLKKELTGLKEYSSNPCMFCGPDNWSVFVCDDCSFDEES